MTAGSLIGSSAAAGSPAHGHAAAEPRAPGHRGNGAKHSPRRTALTRTIHDVVKVVPRPVKFLLAGLAALSVMLLGWSLLTGLRARRLRRQRAALAADVGALQAALLPPVPSRLRGLTMSAAYRPAEGPAAGGDFYDLFELSHGRICAIVGDVSGHGREALASTAFLRYTLRAHAEARIGLRHALRLAGDALERTSDGRFATVLSAMYDPGAGTLTYAAAGHPPPIVAGGAEHLPVVAGSSPPLGLGLGLPTGLRQTTISLPAGAVACLYTDGLVEARRRGRLLGETRLAQIVRELPPEATAEDLVERVAGEADRMPDDLAVCLIRARTHPRSRLRVEELEIEPGEAETGARFLHACGVGRSDTSAAMAHVHARLGEGGPAILRVELERPGPPRVEVLGGPEHAPAVSA